MHELKKTQIISEEGQGEGAQNSRAQIYPTLIFCHPHSKNPVSAPDVDAKKQKKSKTLYPNGPQSGAPFNFVGVKLILMVIGSILC